MQKKCLGIAAGLLMLAGCSNNDFTDNVANVLEGQVHTISSINATIEGADTRVDFVDGNKVNWQESDYIMMYSDLDENDGRRYDLTSGKGTSSATFAGDKMKGTKFYAFTGGTPFNYDRENQEISFYWSQEVIIGGEPNDIVRNIPMFATGSSNGLQFKQLTGVMHFQVKGTGSLVSAEICDNNGEQIPESYTISFKSENITLKPYSSCNGNNPCYYDFFKGNVRTSEGYVDLSETEPVDIYFVLPSCIEYKNGFTLKLGVGDNNGENVKVVEKKSDNSFSVQRGVVANFPAFSTTDITTPEKAWTISGGLNYFGDTVNVFAVPGTSEIIWYFSFLNYEGGKDVKNNMLVNFKTQNNGTTPSLSMLENFETTNFALDIREFASEQAVLWYSRTDLDQTKFTIRKSTDGDVWTISFNGMGVKNRKGDGSVSVNFKYEGQLTLPPQQSWSFSGDANMDD